MNRMIVAACALCLAVMQIDATLGRVQRSPMGGGMDKPALVALVAEHFGLGAVYRALGPRGVRT